MHFELPSMRSGHPARQPQQRHSTTDTITRSFVQNCEIVGCSRPGLHGSWRKGGVPARVHGGELRPPALCNEIGGLLPIAPTSGDRRCSVCCSLQLLRASAWVRRNQRRNSDRRSIKIGGMSPCPAIRSDLRRKQPSRRYRDTLPTHLIRPQERPRERMGLL